MSEVLDLVPFYINSTRHHLSSWLSVSRNDLIILSKQDVYDSQGNYIPYDIEYKFFGDLTHTSMNGFRGTNNGLKVTRRMDIKVVKVQ